MNRVPNPSMFRLLSELDPHITVYVPEGGTGFTTGRKEDSQQYGIHLHGSKRKVYYDGDTKVEVKDWHIPKPF